MRSINLECEALEELQKKFLCSKLNAPIWKQAITIWNFLWDSAEATIVCQPGFVWSGSHRPMAVCDGWIGWNSDGDCIPKRWNSFDMSVRKSPHAQTTQNTPLTEDIFLNFFGKIENPPF